MSAGAQALIGLLMIPWVAIIRGYTLSVLWRWFVVSAFQVRPLRIPEALGIALIVTSLTGNPREDLNAKHPPFWVTMLLQVFGCLFGLALGWIYKAFL